MFLGKSFAEKPLIIAVGDDSYPYQFRDDNGKPAGYLVDLWRQWSKQTGQAVTFVNYPWNESIEAVKRGDADVHAGLANTPTRASLFQFSKPIVQVKTQLYVHYSIGKKSRVEQLSPFNIGVVLGSAHQEILKKMGLNFTLKQYPSKSDLLDNAINQNVYVFAGLEGFIRKRARQQDIFELFPSENRFDLQTGFLYPGILDKNSALVKRIDTGLSKIPQSKYRQIKQKWLGMQDSASGISIELKKNQNPFSDVGTDGLPHGFFVDLWRLWGMSNNVAVNFVFADENDRSANKMTGDFEVTLSNVDGSVVENELSKVWRIYDIKHRLFVYNTPLEKLDELSHSPIGVLERVSYLPALKRQQPNAKIEYFKTLASMIAAAKRGEIRGFISPATLTQHQLLKNKIWADFYQEPRVEFITPVHVLINPQNIGLARRLSKGFTKIEQKDLVDIERKWVLNPADQLISPHESKLSLSDQQKNYLNSLGFLKMGYLRNWAPMEFSDEDNQFSGVNKDVIEHIQQHLNIAIEPIAFDNWPSLFEALKHGRIDLAGSMARSSDREGKVRFTDTYWPTSWALVSNIEHIGLFSLKQLTKHRVAVVEGYALAEKIMAREPNMKLMLVPNSEAGVKAIADGSADVFIDKLMTLSLIMNSSQYYNLNISILPELSIQHSHFGVNPQYEPLIPLMNLALAQLDQAKRRKIYQRWIPDSASHADIIYKKWFQYTAMALTLLIIAFVVYWYINRQLTREIIRRQNVEKKVQYLNTHDNLTGLLNRRLLDDRLTNAVLTHSREQTRFAVMFIGINNFKLINETLCHKVGDEFLIGIANALAGTFRRSDTLARFSSNEFVVILNRAQDFDAVCQVAENALAAISRVIELQIPTLPITANIGIAFYPMDADNPIEILKQADQLKRKAKQLRENSYMTN